MTHYTFRVSIGAKKAAFAVLVFLLFSSFSAFAQNQSLESCPSRFSNSVDSMIRIKDLTLDLSKIDVNKADEEKFIPPEGLRCVGPIGTQESKGMIAILIGNQSGLPMISNIEAYKKSVSELRRKGFHVCMGSASQKTFQSVFTNPFTVAAIFDGHGQGGNLSGLPAPDFSISNNCLNTIEPENLPQGQSQVRLLMLNGCQGLQKVEQWRACVPNALIVGSKINVFNTSGQVLADQVDELIKLIGGNPFPVTLEVGAAIKLGDSINRLYTLGVESSSSENNKVNPAEIFKILNLINFESISK